MKAALVFVWLLKFCQTSANSPSVVVSASRSQYWEYDPISVSCQHVSSGEWTVWKYTSPDKNTDPVLSQCGSGLSTQATSSCNITSAKKLDSGVYWCESEHRDSSNAINITVTDGQVILQSPVLPVMEGHSVSLHCQTKNRRSDRSAGFYKDGTLIRTEPTGIMTIQQVSRSDEGLYTCNISGHGVSPASWLLIRDDSDRATLRVSPDWSQLFEYDSVSLSCDVSRNSHGWRVIRATASDKKVFSCGNKWGTPTPFGCNLTTAKKHDSGIYWCESPTKQRSSSASITVHAVEVILRSPVLPVMEGQNVSLHCQTKKLPSYHPAGFYKDGTLIRTEPTGIMTIQQVSRSDEGLYRCNISGHGVSPPSWLLIREIPSQAPPPADPAPPTVLRVICHLVVFCPYCLSTILMVSVYRDKKTGNEDDEGVDRPYDDVMAGDAIEHSF